VGTWFFLLKCMGSRIALLHTYGKKNFLCF
jgi:hypothetical protein